MFHPHDDINQVQGLSLDIAVHFEHKTKHEKPHVIYWLCYCGTKTIFFQKPSCKTMLILETAYQQLQFARLPATLAMELAWRKECHGQVAGVSAHFFLWSFGVWNLLVVIELWFLDGFGESIESIESHVPEIWFWWFSHVFWTIFGICWVVVSTPWTHWTHHRTYGWSNIYI